MLSCSVAIAEEIDTSGSSNTSQSMPPTAPAFAPAFVPVTPPAVRTEMPRPPVKSAEQAFRERIIRENLTQAQVDIEVKRMEYQLKAASQDARNDMRAGNWKTAEEKLRNIIALFPSVAQLHSDLQQVLARTGRLTESLEESDIALRLEPNNSASLLNRATLLMFLGRLDEAAAAYDNILRRFPNFPQAVAMREVSKRLKIEAAEIHHVENMLNQTGSKTDDYFEFATLHGVTKWSLNRFPLKVFVQSESDAAKVPGYRPEYRQVLVDGFEEWARALGRKSFVFVDRIELADITCRWTNNPALLRNPAECGETIQYSAPGRPISKAEITMLTQAYFDVWNKTISPNCMHTICVHEIGHALGIRGHSPNFEDIMFVGNNKNDDRRSLTTRDIKTIKHLYRPDVQLSGDKYPTR